MLKVTGTISATTMCRAQCVSYKTDLELLA